MRIRRFVAAAALALIAACDSRPPAAPAPKARSVAEIRRDGNHLLGQASPYLEQHAHNPVDWYPWGPEALDRARRENKPIFLSIGYSTCHWCHVMEKESFEDDEVAELLNQRFVAIKIDREERPDVDALFVEAVSRLGQSPGWPLTVIMTPAREPFFGGTYLPKHGVPGRTGLMEVLREVEQRWREEPASLAARGRELLDRIRAEASAPAATGDVDAALLEEAFARIAGARDAVNGGFGSRQKFPNAPLLLAELRFAERQIPGGAAGASATGPAPAIAARSHLVLTLDHALRGGIHDHLAGTFHRYAVDRSWHVPHFEKTLYDNAQLASIYLEAARWLGPAEEHAADLERAGVAVLDDLIATWQRPDGGFVVGFDADDPRGEGAYYTFTPAELAAALGEGDARIVAALFGVTDGGERSLGGRSVLHRRGDEEVAAKLSIAPGAVRDAAARSIPKLAKLRAARPAPAVDDKELAAWNGLAVMALADAGRWLGDGRLVGAAQRAAGFLVTRCWSEKDRTMRRGFRRGAALGEGFLDDYALPALGLLRLHAADGDAAWLVAARAIAEAMIERFHDERTSAFVRARGDVAPEGAAPLPLRAPDMDDGVLPSGGAAATLLLLELGAMTGDAALIDRAARAMRVAAAHIKSDPFSSGASIVALDHATASVREVVIAGDPSDPRTAALVAELASTTAARVLPMRVPAAGASAALVRAFPSLEGKSALGGKPTAFVCKRGACEAPTGDPAALRQKLAAAR